jgi:tripartite-type tricarboxylate transporter receptor subunit TctC
MRMSSTFLSAVVVIVVTLSVSVAEAADNFYRDKTIRILTAAAGGSYDAFARLVARHLPNHIDGGVRAVVVQNMPGATIKIPLYLKDIASRDPTVIGSLNNAVAFAPLLDVPQADFDAAKFNWLGSPSTETGLAVVWHTVPINSIADATRREVIMGTGGGGASASFFGRLLNAALGTKFKLLSGYSGTSSIYLAMERGEIEGFPSALWSDLQLTKADWIAQKKIKILVQYGRRRPELPDVPVARQIAKTEADRQLLDFAMAPLDLGRPYVMAPDVPPANVQTLRAALMATFDDPAFVADAKKQYFPLDAVPKSGDDLKAIVAGVYNAPKEIRSRLVALYKQEAN